MRIRPLRPDDPVDIAEAAALARSGRTNGLAEASRSSGQTLESGRIVAHVARHDPAGCWVADDAGSVVGVALSTRRDLLWCLSVLVVAERATRIGDALLEAALAYSRGCLRGISVVPDDPWIARHVRQAGFTLHPTMRLTGQVERAAVPPIDGVWVARPVDRAMVDSVDRQVRAAARGPDHDMLSADAELVVCDTRTGSGYSYHRGGSPVALAATNRAVARRLLWAGLARVQPSDRVEIERLTAAQDWAVDVGLAAGLGIHTGGFVAVRHMSPPAPYLPSARLG